MANLITPRTLKGFRDYLPETMMPRERLMETARQVYRSYGFAPIDTPALEYLEILAGKGGEETDKQLYRFTDHGGRDVGLRFDLTVPLARFAAQYGNELGTPFKRYQIAPVWRGENTQRGRYREFCQCDFDTIGTEAVAADIETVLVVHSLLTAIGFEAFTIHLNHRGLLNGVLESAGLLEQAGPVLRALDKLAKIGREGVEKELVDRAGLRAAAAASILELATIEGSNEEVLAKVTPLVAASEQGKESVARLEQVVAAVLAAGPAPGQLQLDVSIARGLDYYTGLVLETTLDDLPGIGSVASGGRYDDLAQRYSKQRLPGIGASLGLDRLLAAMEELELLDPVRTPAEILLTFFDRDHLSDYVRMAADLRSAGLAVELYPEPKKLGKQLQYADRRGHQIAVIVGGDEWSAGTAQVKILATKESTTVPQATLVEHLRGVLSAPTAE